MPCHRETEAEDLKILRRPTNAAPTRDTQQLTGVQESIQYQHLFAGDGRLPRHFLAWPQCWHYGAAGSLPGYRYRAPCHILTNI